MSTKVFENLGLDRSNSLASSIGHRVASLLFILAMMTAFCRPAAAQDTLEQVMSTNLHLGVQGARVSGQSAFSGQLSLSFPLRGFLRGMHLELGVASFATDDGFHASIPLSLRYIFLTGSLLAPYLQLGTGYYVSSADESDHGFQFLHGGAGIEYFFAEKLALGLGLDLHALPVSMKNEGARHEVSWLAYGLKASAIF